MSWIKWLGAVAAIVLIIACFLPWVKIEYSDTLLTGIDTAGTRFGKPGYFHFFLCFLFMVLNFIPRVWAKRTNLLVVALNISWTLRNFFVMGACEAGECPARQIGLYLVLLSSLIMLVAALFPDVKLPQQKKDSRHPS
jgi:hypothetical protein